LAKPEEIKGHQESQEGNQKEKKETPDPISFQERMKTQIARPDLQGNESNDRTAKEETIFQDQKEPPPVIGLASAAEPHSPLWADFLPAESQSYPPLFCSSPVYDHAATSLRVFGFFNNG